MQPNYNLIAPFYKSMVKLVFGNTLHTAFSYYLKEIKAGDTVLIVGGGNGEILVNLYLQQPNCSIEYLELSSKMLAIAKRKNPFPKENIVFTERNFFELLQEENTKPYDWVIFPFFLDQFTQEHILEALNWVKPNATNLILTDFHPDHCPPWLLRSMYLFFVNFAQYETNKLIKIEPILKDLNFTIKEQKFFSNKKVVSYWISMLA